MEMIQQTPRVMVDGAHNAASVDALMRAIGQNVPCDSMVIIFGCRKDKDIAGMLRHTCLGADKIIFTSTGSARATAPLLLEKHVDVVHGYPSSFSEALNIVMGDFDEAPNEQ